MRDEVPILLQTLREAGAAILSLQKDEKKVFIKSNHDVVTQADLTVNTILKSRLIGRFPNDGWLSEETADDFKRLQHARVWIVDPIDGTREFIKDIPEYAISVALVEQGVPVVAGVFNPATNELFYAIKNQGSWQGEKKLHCLSSSSNETLVLLASRSEFDRGEWDRFQSQQVRPMGSIAYKLALVAAGRAHATFSLGPKNEWDVAAGVLLVMEAGGIVSDQCRKQMIFNQKKTKVNGIVATAADVNEKVFDLIGRKN